ncbi:epithelial splicing regulatory protein 2-like [Haemaphysalis longicornis]
MDLLSFIAPFTSEPFVGKLPRLLQWSSRKNCLLLRGLPYDSELNTLLEFMGDFRYAIALEGVHRIKTLDGRPAGQAFVQMESEDAAFLAAMHLHHGVMTWRTPRCIEVFQCSVDDMNRLVTEPVPMARFGQPGFPFGVYQPGTRPMQPPGAVPTMSPACVPPAAYWPLNSPFSTSDRSKMAGATKVLLRGLPYHATVRDILVFFRGFPYLTADSVSMRRKANGRPNGEAMVAFPTPAEAQRAVKQKHLRKMGRRYIEVLIA